MKTRQNGLFASGLLWIGAATSLAEIEAGIHCGNNLVAVLFGHLLGFVLLFAMGLVGGQTRRTAMRTTKEAFGDIGCRFFAGLNLLQLVGWTAVMVSMGAVASDALFPQVGFPVFCLVVGGLAVLGLLVDFKQSSFLATGTVFLLAALAAVLTVNVLALPSAAQAAETPSFSSAFELSVAMPLSWLPLISDHTKDADRPVAASFVSARTGLNVLAWACGFIVYQVAGSSPIGPTLAAVLTAAILAGFGKLFGKMK